MLCLRDQYEVMVGMTSFWWLSYVKHKIEYKLCEHNKRLFDAITRIRNKQNLSSVIHLKINLYWP